MAKVQNVFSLNGTILAVLCFSLNVKFFLTKKTTTFNFLERMENNN